MKSSMFRTLGAGAIALVISACGGGGSDSSTSLPLVPTPPATGTATTDISVGAITAFGSVWVNGVEFKSSNATIKIDDNPKPESDLRVGMVARVEGSISGASATTITVNSAAKGYVESVSGNQMVVMGQTVIVDGATTISNGPITAGNYVEIHGLVVSDGTISATFIEKKTTQASPPFAVKGFVKAHNTTTNAFSVGALNITMTASPTLNDMPAGSWNGLQVEVKGTACAGNPPATNVCGTLSASKVEPHGPRGTVAKVEVEGFVSSFASAASFTVGNQAVTTSSSTVFQGGFPADLVLGTKVEVEGSLSAGVLTASKVSFRENSRFEANIASISSGNTLTLTGLGGVIVQTNSLTRFKNVNFAGLSVGNNLKIRGRPGNNGIVTATEIEQKSTAPDTRVIMQGVATVVGTNVTLHGITFDASAMSTFKDKNDNVITKAQFFAVATTGTLIKARGGLTAGVVNWNQEIQLED